MRGIQRFALRRRVVAAAACACAAMIASVALGVAAVASGAAEPPQAPEFGRCIKAEGKSGTYKDAGCTSLKSGGEYEWLSLAKPGFTTVLISGTSQALLVPVHGKKVSCSAESGAGEITGPKAVGGETFTLTRCTHLGNTCTSAGAASGEIRIGPLEGVLGVEALGETAAKDKLAVELFPAGRTAPFAEFTCGPQSMFVRGAVILPLPANKMASTSLLKFAQVKGIQNPEKLLEGPRAVLEVSTNGHAYERIGLGLKVTQTDEEAMEANSVF